MLHLSYGMDAERVGISRGKRKALAERWGSGGGTSAENMTQVAQTLRQ